MKPCLLICWLFFVATSIYAQSPVLPLNNDTKKITYTEVVPVDGTRQTELYSRARLWFINTFKSANSAVQPEEKEPGVLIGRGWQDINIVSLRQPVSIMLWYTARITCKDGRYKYDLSDFAIQYHPTPEYLVPPVTPAENFLGDGLGKKGKPDTLSPQIRQQLNEAASQLAADLKAAMQKPAAGTANGKDW